MTATTLPPVVLPALTPGLAALPPYVFAWLDELKAAARARGTSLIDLGIGSPDRPTPEPVREVIAHSVERGVDNGYPPFRGTERFRRAAAGYLRERFGVTVDPARELLCVSGGKESIAQLTLAYVDQQGVALVPDIYYPVHARATGMAGGRVHPLPLRAENGFLPRLDEIPDDVARRARLLILNYPHNPTGAVAPLSFLEEAVAFCRRWGIVLLSDLAYAEIGFDGYRAPSVLQIPEARDVAVEVHSCSKSFNMAGFRVAFVAGNAAVLDALYAVRMNMGYGTTVSIQEGAAWALEHAAELAPVTAAHYQERRDALVAGFRSLGWDVAPSRASMFLWLPVPAGYTSQGWTERLVDAAGVVVTPGNAFGPGGEGWFRVSLVAPPAALDQAIERLRAAGLRYR